MNVDVDVSEELQPTISHGVAVLMANKGTYLLKFNAIIRATWSGRLTISVLTNQRSRIVYKCIEFTSETEEIINSSVLRKFNEIPNISKQKSLL